MDLRTGTQPRLSVNHSDPTSATTNQQQQPQNHGKSTVTETICLWDLESFDHLMDYQIQPLIRNVRDDVQRFVEGKTVEKAFLVACDVVALRPGTSNALNKVKNLDIVHVDSSTSSVSNKLKQKLHQYDMDYRSNPGIIVFLSGNDEFGFFLSNMTRSGWKVFLFHPPAASSELLECADFSKDICEILHLIDVDPNVTKPSMENGESSFLLAANLPQTFNSSDRLVAFLNRACLGFDGEVSYINQFTSEAVIHFLAKNEQMKGESAALLVKTFHDLYGYDISALAIKDPSIELTRMKFTIQQDCNIPSQTDGDQQQQATGMIGGNNNRNNDSNIIPPAAVHYYQNHVLQQQIEYPVHFQQYQQYAPIPAAAMEDQSLAQSVHEALSRDEVSPSSGISSISDQYHQQHYQPNNHGHLQMIEYHQQQQQQQQHQHQYNQQQQQYHGMAQHQMMEGQPGQYYPLTEAEHQHQQLNCGQMVVNQMGVNQMVDENSNELGIQFYPSGTPSTFNEELTELFPAHDLCPQELPTQEHYPALTGDGDETQGYDQVGTEDSETKTQKANSKTATINYASVVKKTAAELKPAPQINNQNYPIPSQNDQHSQSGQNSSPSAACCKKSMSGDLPLSPGSETIASQHQQQQMSPAATTGGSVGSNSSKSSTTFTKPNVQCFHWDNPTHLSQSLRECKFWHPRERCRFYPSCSTLAGNCGYAHPFCGVYCECEPEKRDPQKNHRLKPPAYIRDSMGSRNEVREREIRRRKEEKQNGNNHRKSAGKTDGQQSQN